MGWRDLLQDPEERVIVPWLGGRSLRFGSRVWEIEGPLPYDHGWYRFNVRGRRAFAACPSEPLDSGNKGMRGYLVLDRLLDDERAYRVKTLDDLLACPAVALLEPGLDRFCRIRALRYWPDGPLVFASQEFPLGSEDEVLQRYLDRKDTIHDIKGVTPGLALAFRLETWHRAEVEQKRREEQERREREERRRALVERLGDGQVRRELAKIDFQEAAIAALAVGGAEYQDHRAGRARNEFIVRFRMDGRRWECVCDDTLHVIDSGICLQDHDTGEKGDTYFTLESLPSVIREGMRQGAAIWRHVD